MKINLLASAGAIGAAALLAFAVPSWADKHVEDAKVEKAEDAATKAVDETKSDDTKAEETTSDAAKTEDTTSDDAKAEEAKSEEAKSEEAKSEEAKPEATKSEETEAEETAAPIEPKHVVGDIVLGDADAPITIIEYASLTCPHCARFHTDVYPQIKENYIDTGKAKMVIREVYFDKFGLWASMTARCGGEAGFYPMVDVFLETQNVWTRAPDIAKAIHQIGRRAGLSNERLNACLADRDFAKELLEDYKTNAEADDIRSTPTFVINGEKHGNMSYEEFAKILDSES